MELNRSSQAHESSDTHHRSSQSIELLTFVLNEVIFGLDILHVEEIHSYQNPYSLLDINNSVHPVISARGNKIEIIDFGIKFGLYSKNNQQSKNIIILNHHEKQFGIIIDGVAEVISTNRSLLVMPEFSEDAFNGFSYTSGLIKIDEHVLVVLDLEKLINHHEKRLDDGRNGE